MATRADFDAALADLASAIQAAAARFGGGGGPTITDQDIATLQKDVRDVNALGTGGGGGTAFLAISPAVIPPTSQATCTLTVKTAPTTDQVWNVSSSSPEISVPATVTVPAGQFSVDFKVTAGAPSVDTPCTIKAFSGAQSVQAVCTVSHA